jgi:hypothetical protein
LTLEPILKQVVLLVSARFTIQYFIFHCLLMLIVSHRLAKQTPQPRFAVIIVSWAAKVIGGGRQPMWS